MALRAQEGCKSALKGDASPGMSENPFLPPVSVLQSNISKSRSLYFLKFSANGRIVDP